MLYFFFETSSLSVKAIDHLCGLIDRLQKKYPKNSKCFISGNYSDDLLETLELSGWDVILGKPPDLVNHQNVTVFRKKPHDFSESVCNSIYLCSESGKLFLLASST